MRTSLRVQYRWALFLGCTLNAMFALSSTAFAEPPTIKISVDRSSLNQTLSHLHGSIFANTWEQMPFRPTIIVPPKTSAHWPVMS